MASDEEIQVPITYTPTNVGEDEGQLLLETNDPTARTKSIRILTTQAESELVASPATLEFFSDEGQAIRKTVDLYNLGAVPVTVTGFRLLEGSDDEFRILTPSMPKEIRRSRDRICSSWRMKIWEL